jgi:hypothetical protein
MKDRQGKEVQTNRGYAATSKKTRGKKLRGFLSTRRNQVRNHTKNPQKGKSAKDVTNMEMPGGQKEKCGRAD